MSRIEKAARSLAIPPVPMTVKRLKLSSSERELVWSSIVESCEDRKNSLIAEIIGLALISDAGAGTVSVGVKLILSLITLSSLKIPTLKAFCATNSPTLLTLLLPKWSMSSTLPLPDISSNK